MFKRAFFFTALFAGLLTLNSCESGGGYKPEILSQRVKEKLKKLPPAEEEKLKALASAIYPRGWKVINIFAVEDSEDGFKKYLVAVYNPFKHAVFFQFLWLTPDGKFLTNILYEVGKNKVSLIVPAQSVDYPLESLRWLLDVERIILSANLPQTLLTGRRYLYLIWNPYCEECFRNWRKLLELAKKQGWGIKLIPYHNIYYPLDNLYMLVYLFHRAKSEGLFTVLNGYYLSSKDFETFLEKLKTDAFKDLKNIPKEEFNSIGLALKQVNEILKNAKIFIVPTLIEVKTLNPTAGLASGYVYVGKFLPNFNFTK